MRPPHTAPVALLARDFVDCCRNEGIHIIFPSCLLIRCSFSVLSRNHLSPRTQRPSAIPLQRWWTWAPFQSCSLCLIPPVFMPPVGCCAATGGRASHTASVVLSHSGKGGRMTGNLMGMMAVLKGTPTTYNKDFQESWELMFETVDTLHDCIRISTGVLSTLTINPDNMMKGLSADMLATDLAEYLVRKGIPFRETHHISGECVKLAEDTGCALSELSVEALKGINPLFDDDVVEVWDYQRSAEMRDTEGGTSKRSVLEQVEKLRTYLEENSL